MNIKQNDTDDTEQDNTIFGDWGCMAPYDYGYCPYVPNPHYRIYSIPSPSITSLEDIIPIQETYTWESIKSSCYLHIIRMNGICNSKMDLTNGAVPVLGRYEKMKETPPENIVTAKQVLHYQGYYFDEGYIHMYWHYNMCELGISPYNPYRIIVIFKPAFRSNLWDSLGWILKKKKEIENIFCVGRLKPEQIELPIDFMMGEYNHKALERCYNEHYSDMTYRLIGKQKDTLYNGENSKARMTKIYEKDDGWWHIEPTLRGRYFRSKESFKEISHYSVLLYLIRIYVSTDFRYLDLCKMVSSDKYQELAYPAWDRFVRHGNRVATEYLKAQGVKNPHRYFSRHTFDEHYKNALAETIHEGLKTIKKCRDIQGVEQMRDVLENTETRKKLIKALERLSCIQLNKYSFCRLSA